MDAAAGGWGALFRRFLNLLLLGDIGFSSSGLALELGGQPVMLYAELAMVLADLDGHRMAWDAKGSAGIRLCLLHPKVLKIGSGIADSDDSFVEISCHDPRRFGKARSNDIYTSADLLTRAQGRVQAGAMTRVRFSNLENMRAELCTVRLLLGCSLEAACRLRIGDDNRLGPLYAR